MLYPDTQSSGKTANPTARSWHCRATFKIAPALAAGSARLVLIVQAATRRNPCL